MWHKYFRFVSLARGGRRFTIPLLIAQTAGNHIVLQRWRPKFRSTRNMQVRPRSDGWRGNPCCASPFCTARA